MTKVQMVDRDGASHAGGAHTEEEASLNALLQERGALSAEIGRLKAAGQDASTLIARSKALSLQINSLRDRSPRARDGSAGFPELSCELLNTTEQFEALREDWDQLVDHCGAAVSPFMRWQWLFPWWKHFGQGRPLRIFAVRDAGGRLLALAPLMLGLRESGRFHPRTLAFVGSGHEGPMGQDFHVLLAADGGEPAESALWSSVSARSGEWDVLRLWKLGDHPMAVSTMMGAARHAANGAYMRPSGVAVWAALPPTYEEFLRSVPSQVERRLMRNQFDRLESRFGSVEFRACEGEQDLRDGANQVMDFNVARLGSRSTWREPRYRLCLQEMVLLLAQTGRVWVPLIQLEGAAVAGAIVLRQDDALFAFVAGFSPTHAHDNPMRALWAGLVRRAIAQRLQRLDLLSDHRYVRRIAGCERHIYHCDVFSNTAASFELSARRLWFRALRRRGKALLVGTRTPRPNEDTWRDPAHADTGAP